MHNMVIIFKERYFTACKIAVHPDARRKGPADPSRQQDNRVLPQRSWLLSP